MNGTEIITFLSNNLDTISSAVGPVAGALFTAIFLRHNTKTDEFEKIKTGQFKEVADDLLASGKMTYTEYYKANNFLTVAKKADGYYREHPRLEEKGTYDFDWFMRFFEAVGNVSDETMQNLWAKILAREIAQPSTFSLKTVDVMRNLSKRDAELFIKVCSHSFISSATNYFLPNEDEFIEYVGIQYADIMKLSELGLIFNDATITLNMDISNEPQILINNHSLIMLITSASGNSEKASIRQYPFTEVGKELSTMISESASDEDFVKYGQLLSRNKSHKISVHKVIKWNGDSVEYNKINLIPQEVPATE
ncbi:MAG: DUF2806 domain-containing protein [Lachnospiraceae bacterium]